MEWERYYDLFGVPGVDKVWWLRCGGDCDTTSCVRAPVGATSAACPACGTEIALDGSGAVMLPPRTP